MIPVIGFVGYSNSGKTTLAVQVVKELQKTGTKVAVIKHDPHGHYKEASGTDSAKYGKSGAQTVIVVSPMSAVRLDHIAYPSLDEVIDTVHSVDCIIVEGYKMEKHPKIAVFRTQQQSGILTEIDTDTLIAIATNLVFTHSGVPVLNLDKPAAVTSFIQTYLSHFPGIS